MPRRQTLRRVEPARVTAAAPAPHCSSAPAAVRSPAAATRQVPTARAKWVPWRENAPPLLTVILAVLDTNSGLDTSIAPS